MARKKKKQEQNEPSDYKTMPFIELKVDSDQGIVEHLIAVHGVLDHGKDISMPGSWSKTIQDQGLKIKVLDLHNRTSIKDVIGKPLEVKEIGRDDLPEKVLERWPEATGAVAARTQFLMETPEGAGAFARIKSGAVTDFSYGYDAIKTDYETVKDKSGEDVEARLLKEVRAWEYGPVIWGMNPATMTMSAKSEEPEPPAESADEEKELVARCPSCGYTTSAPIELDDLMACPECGADLERVEAKEEEQKVEVTENYIRIPAGTGDHGGHRIRTITLSASQGIKALYCGECKKVVTYLFDKDKWDVARAKEWVKEHRKGLDFALQNKWSDEEEEDPLAIAMGLHDIDKELLNIELLELEIKALDIQ